MDIALIIGVVLGMVFMIGSIAYALFVEGAAGGFGNFVSIPSFGIVFGGMLASVDGTLTVRILVVDLPGSSSTLNGKVISQPNGSNHSCCPSRVFGSQNKKLS